jgi:hypothetical protein
MPRGKQWATTELAVLARAYKDATNNPIKGADQTSEDFVADILSNLECLAPSDLPPTISEEYISHPELRVTDGFKNLSLSTTLFVSFVLTCEADWTVLPI